MCRVLFVDDDPNVLKGFKRMLSGMRKEWEMHFIDDAAAAVDLLAVLRELFIGAASSTKHPTNKNDLRGWFFWRIT